MIIINPGKNDSVNKLLSNQLTNIQTQLDELSDRITSLDGSTGTEIEEVQGNLREISLILDDVIQTQQMTSAAFAELTESLNELKALLSDEVETKNINAIIAEIATINATNINTETVTAQTGNITNVNADNVNAENAKVTNLEVENVSISELETDSFKTKQAEIKNYVGESATLDELTVENIKSKQTYSSQSYGSNEYVDKFKFVLNAGAIIYSEDADDPWALTWNGAIEYTNPKLTIKRIDITKENDTVVAFVYFYHPNTDLTFSVLNFGNSDIDAHFELVEKATAYEEENVEYFGIAGELTGEGGGLQLIFVDEIPETVLKDYLYAVVNENGIELFAANENGKAVPLVTTISELIIRESVQINNKLLLPEVEEEEYSEGSDNDYVSNKEGKPIWKSPVNQTETGAITLTEDEYVETTEEITVTEKISEDVRVETGFYAAYENEDIFIERGIAVQLEESDDAAIVKDFTFSYRKEIFDVIEEVIIKGFKGEKFVINIGDLIILHLDGSEEFFPNGSDIYYEDNHTGTLEYIDTHTEIITKREFKGFGNAEKLPTVNTLTHWNGKVENKAGEVITLPTKEWFFNPEYVEILVDEGDSASYQVLVKAVVKNLFNSDYTEEFEVILEPGIKYSLTRDSYPARGEMRWSFKVGESYYYSEFFISAGNYRNVPGNTQIGDEKKSYNPLTKLGEVDEGEWNAGKITSNEAMDIKHESVTWQDEDYGVWLNGAEPTEDDFDWVRR